jgi:hypothetical protein
MRTVVAICNDLHVGSPFAVSPARWLLQSGNVFTPNEMQNAILAHWCACWQRVAQLRKGARLVVLIVGDATEGLHHDSKEIITPRQDEQEDMAIAVIESALKLAKFRKGDSIYFVTGTAAHDGDGSASLNRIARSILDVDANDGTRCVYDTLQRTVNGVRFDVTHRPSSGPGSRAQTTGNAFQAWLKSLYLTGLEAGSWPRYVITAHYHQYLKRSAQSITDSDTVVTGYIAPAWKLHDSYIKGVVPFGFETVGMLAFEVFDDGRVTEHDAKGTWRILVKPQEIQEL